jgi:DNA-binding NarL/FixJ family response regulator/signal transduction histidine kinase
MTLLESELSDVTNSLGLLADGQVEPHDVLARLSSGLAGAVPHDYVNLVLEEDTGTLISVRTSARTPAAERPGLRQPLAGSGLAVVFEHGAPLILPAQPDITPLTTSARREHRLMAELDLGSYLAVPLVLGHHVVGALEIGRHGREGFGHAEVADTEAFAGRITAVVHATHQYLREARQRSRLATLVEMSRAMAALLDLEEILPRISAALEEVLGLPVSALYLHDADRRALVRRPPTPSHVPADPLLAAAGLCRSVLSTDEPLGALLAQPRVPTALDGPPPVFVVPFVIRDRLVALAALPIPDPDQCFSDRQFELVRGIGQSGALAIEHARLYEQARELGMAEERNRLAREVHDTLAQDLAGISLQLQVAARRLPSGADAERHILEAHDLARQALEEARRVVWGLLASGLQDRSLAEALADEVAVLSRRTEVEASFVQRGDAVRLDDQQAGALLRVAQEALHNVEKHAAAQRVRVELDLDRETGQLTLLIADDGRGFVVSAPPHASRAGFGLTSMRERMRLAGGELDIESAPGWGTRVRARLPVGSADVTEAPVPDQLATTASEPIRVLIVDDHPVARAGLRHVLDEQSDVVVIGQASDGAEGVERALALRPDVVLMDLQMPRLSGVAAIRSLREAWPEARVLVLTTFGQDEHLFEALRAGARGYLLKSVGGDELAQAIQSVHAGGALVQPALTTRLVDRFGALAEREQLAETLTEREAEVLRLLATGARNREIAARLVVTEKTIKHHVGQIHAKLGVRTRTEAVARARQLGLLPLDAFAIA